MPTARELTNHLARLLREEQGAMADFLVTLAAFDREKRWRELGHTSLFYFLHRELKLSKGAAHNRKTAADLIQAFPEVETALRAGDLCLSTVTEVAKVLTPENRAEVLPRFFGLSRREAEAEAVTLRPAEVVPSRDVIIPLRPAVTAAQDAVPATASASPAAGAPEERQPAVHMDEPPAPAAPAASAAPAVAATQARLAAPPPPLHSVDLLDAELARMHVTVSRRFLAKLEAARDALGHACPGGGVAEILERGLDLVLARHAKRRGVVEKPRKVPPPSSGVAIPAHVKRAVWRRAGGRCEFRLDSGEVCGSSYRLEFDHFPIPKARGGPATIENLRLACRPHNLLGARRTFGDALMDRYAGPP